MTMPRNKSIESRRDAEVLGSLSTLSISLAFSARGNVRAMRRRSRLMGNLLPRSEPTGRAARVQSEKPAGLGKVACKDVVIRRAVVGIVMAERWRIDWTRNGRARA